MSPSIPPEVLVEVDPLLLSREFFAAIFLLRERTGCTLATALEQLTCRSGELETLHPAFGEAEAKRRWKERSPEAWRAKAREALDALPRPPVAIEVQWDGDSLGWCLDVFAILPGASTAHPRFTCAPLVTMRPEVLGSGDARAVALEVGQWAQERWGTLLYFPSPAESLDEPRWWDTLPTEPGDGAGS
ncbi:hypothetical protein LXT21_13100 [Myxococcus sp. K38C18041901]|uniref:hypothetical protein n=1 Tax=Myxococcus guangdongensis TaxID=2906760 RepID=UPI0020A7D930|nr:hypothetical protein [Myxococcus guangdongensis]MCP3059717.1 hypothetical protein [Myxococcus guangdongensis]